MSQQLNSSKNFSSLEDEDPLTGSDDESFSESDGRRKGGSRVPLDKNSEEYKRRREKNNEAVRRSREKAKIKYTLTEDRIQKLRAEKQELETKANGMKKELNVLQELAKSLGIDPEDGGSNEAHTSNQTAIPSASIKLENPNFGYM